MKARVLKLYHIDEFGLFIALCEFSDGSTVFSLCPPSIDVGDSVFLHKIEFFCCSNIK